MISPQCDLHTRPSYFNQAKNEADFSHDYISGKHHQARKKSFTFDNGFLYADSMFVFVGRTKWLLPLMFQMHEGGNNHRQQESKTPRENLKAYLPPRGSRKTIPLDTLAEP